MEGSIAKRNDQTTGDIETEVRLGSGLVVVFEEINDGDNRVVSHRSRQVFDPGSQFEVWCDYIDGPCEPNGRLIGSLHLGEEKLIARAEREAERLR